MTNKELQEKLKRYPDDANVLYSDGILFEADVCDVEYEEEWNVVLLFTTLKGTPNED